MDKIIVVAFVTVSFVAIVATLAAAVSLIYDGVKA